MRFARGTRRVGYLAIGILVLGLSGCAGTRVSSRPIYPDSWATLDTQRTCPDLTGKYLAVSEEAAPLAYPPGGEPRDMAFFVTYGKPERPPPLGRRILTWHLAGAVEKTDRDVWNALARYAASIDANAMHSGARGDKGWVLVRQQLDHRIEVHAGLRGNALLDLVLSQQAQGFLTHQNHVYQCKNGGLQINGGFPPPPVENPNHTVAYGDFTFYRAVDGSLVMLEELFAGSQTLVFKKWWRWLQYE